MRRFSTNLSISFPFVAQRYRIHWILHSAPHYVLEGSLCPFLVQLYSILKLPSWVISSLMLFLISSSVLLWNISKFVLYCLQFLMNAKYIFVISLILLQNTTCLGSCSRWGPKSFKTQSNTLSTVSLVLKGFTVILKFVLSSD